MTQTSDSQILRPIAGVLWASLAGGWILLLLAAIESVGCGTEGCGKMQIITHSPLIVLLLPVTYVASIGVAVVVLLPIAYALDEVRMLTLLSLIASMLVVSALAPLVFRWASFVVVAIWLSTLSAVFWRVALNPTK